MSILASSSLLCPELAVSGDIGERMTVRCNHCMAVFEEEEIIDQDGEETCPHCGKCGGLMDMASADRHGVQRIRAKRRYSVF